MVKVKNLLLPLLKITSQISHNILYSNFPIQSQLPINGLLFNFFKFNQIIIVMLPISKLTLFLTL